MDSLGKGHGFWVFKMGWLLRGRVWQRIKRNSLVLGVLYFLKMDVGDLLVLDASRVVITDKAWYFGKRHNVLF